MLSFVPHVTRIDVERRKIAVSIWTMFTLFVNLSETMVMLFVQCFQYLCITALYLFTGITLVNKMEQLERKIEAVESRKDQIMYQTHFLLLKAKFFNDFCQQDPSKMERTPGMLYQHYYLAFTIYSAYFTNSAVSSRSRKGKGTRKGKEKLIC